MLKLSDTFLIESWEDIESEFIEPKSGRRLYRGQSDACWKLEPSLIRNKKTFDKTLEIEKKIIADFKDEVNKQNLRSYINIQELNNEFDIEWQWLCQAQHLGIPTRLLDWTNEWAVVLFFALEAEKVEKGELPRNDDKDAAFWVQYLWPGTDDFCPDNFNNEMFPNKMESSGFCNPPNSWIKKESFEMAAGVQNRLNQRGKFFVFSDSDLFKPLETQPRYIWDEIEEQNRLRKYVIPKELKDEFRKKLSSIRSTATVFWGKSENGPYEQVLKKLDDLAFKLREKYGYVP